MIECIISSSILILLVIFLRFIFRRRVSNTLIYALWIMVVLRLFMPFSLFESPASVMSAVEHISIRTEASAEYILPSAQENTSSNVHDDNNAEQTANNTPLAQKSEPNIPVYIIWGAVSTAMILWFLSANIFFFRQLKKHRVPFKSNCKLPVYIADVPSPCIFGIFRPAIYLTQDTAKSENNTLCAITHELCHFKHGDHIWCAVRILCIAVWWWNPLVWSAAYLSRADAELACDEAAIKAIGEQNRLLYGNALLEISAARRTAFIYSASTMSAGKKQLKERLKMIVNKPKNFISAAIAMVLIAAVCAACTFAGAEQNISPYTLTSKITAENIETIQISASDGSHDLSQEYCGRTANIISAVSAGSFTNSSQKQEYTGNSLFVKGKDFEYTFKQCANGSVEFSADDASAASFSDGHWYINSKELYYFISSPVCYTIKKLSYGNVVCEIKARHSSEVQMANDILMDYIVKSTFLDGTNITDLNECYMIEALYSDGTVSKYYAYVNSGGTPVLQSGNCGYSSAIKPELFNNIKSAF